MSEARSILLATAALAVVGIGGGAMVSYTWNSAADRIALNERNFRLRALNEIVPPARYDNELFDDTIAVRNPDLLGTDEPLTVYRARSGDTPVAAILNVVAPNGYSGEIQLLVGINYDGTLAGVRVTGHRETPGLGDKIEIEKNDWITVFTGRSLEDPPAEQWRVRKDGGSFDQFTGATITPRAVVKAVRLALVYFGEHRDELFAAAPTATST